MLRLRTAVFLLYPKGNRRQPSVKVQHVQIIPGRFIVQPLYAEQRTLKELPMPRTRDFVAFQRACNPSVAALAMRIANAGSTCILDGVF
jgi:hypothetical protein